MLLYTSWGWRRLQQMLLQLALLGPGCISRSFQEYRRLRTGRKSPRTTTPNLHLFPCFSYSGNLTDILQALRSWATGPPRSLLRSRPGPRPPYMGPQFHPVLYANLSGIPYMPLPSGNAFTGARAGQQHFRGRLQG